MPFKKRKILAELKEWDYWAEHIASDCKEYEQRYAGIPAPRGTCKLTGGICEFDSCPKRNKQKEVVKGG